MRDIRNVPGFALSWEFDSWSEFIDSCRLATQQVAKNPFVSCGVFGAPEAPIDTHWNGGAKTVGEAFQVAEDGWKAVLDGIKPLEDDLVPAMRKRRRRVWSDQDGTVDIDRYQESNDRPFRTTKRELQEDPQRLTLVVAPFGSASDTTETWANRVRTALRIMEKATMQGVVVEMWALYGGLRSTQCLTGGDMLGEFSLVPIVRPGDSVSTHIVTACMHPAMSRTCYTRWWASTAYNGHKYGGGGGYPLRAADALGVIEALWPEKAGTVAVVGGATNEAAIEALLEAQRHKSV